MPRSHRLIPIVALCFVAIARADEATTAPTTAPASTAGDVRLTINAAPAKPGDYKPADVGALVLDDGLLRITFGKDATGDFSATSVVKNNVELEHNLHGVEPRDVDARRSFYLDSNAGKGHLVVDTVRVVANTPAIAHFAVIDNRALHLEHHFVMLRGESGVHPYVIVRSEPNANTGETRTMYRFDMDVLDWAWTPERTGRQPKYALLQSISEKGNLGDETWRLPDGSVYQKYDYALYFAEAPMWGHYGHGLGAWFIPPSTESYAGGPLRQELAVHQDALILNYIGGGHFSGGGTAAGRSGAKIHGPWYLYFNAGDTPEAIIADARKTAEAERAKWPYQWVDEPLYPTHRTAVSGRLKLSHDRPAAGAQIVLGQPAATTRPTSRPTSRRGGGGTAVDPASVLYTQAGDYLFTATADDAGRFTLRGVRPGTYTLYAWQQRGPVTQSLAVDGVEVKGDAQDLGDVAWDAPFHPTLLWQIGRPDRKAGEFKLGDAPRSNQLINGVPADLTFTIGKSREAVDWYFAQPGGGAWTVAFDVASVPAGNAYLTVAVAGGMGDVTAAINGHDLGRLTYGDDASVRRAANRSGRYGRDEFTFPASLLKPGANTLTLTPTNGGRGTALMYDTLVLEAD